MRHALGVLGVLAAGVLLAVSAAMNWRFGFSLGKSEFDGQIYGSASAAADCLKALVPFFFFAALRNRMWSQATASALVWVVVTGYSLTSALGHAALNRLDTTGQRAMEAQSYKDLRADLKRATDEQSWIPQHRPALTVQGDIDSVKNQRYWSTTNGCADVKGSTTRAFCDRYHSLNAELASAQQSIRLNERIAVVKAKLDKVTGHGSTVLSAADPQATVLAKLTGIDMDKVQIALTVMIAMLLEIGSGLGMYIAFSQWRIDDRQAPRAPRMANLATPRVTEVVEDLRTAVVAQPIVAEPQPAIAQPAAAQVALAKPRETANDNSNKQVVAQPRLVAPENDVQKFYKENVDTQNGSSVTATELYEDYCAWCEDLKKEPMALPTFSRQFGELGVKKDKIAGRVRYIGIALKSATADEGDKKPPVFGVQAA